MPTPLARNAPLSQAENRNAVLAMLPAREFKLVAEQLETVEFSFLDMMYEPFDPIHYIYFLQRGVASVVNPMENGSEIEVGMIGNDGVLGSSVLLGVDRTPSRTFIQLPGGGHRIKSEVMRRFYDENSLVRDTLMRGMHAYTVQVAQTAACNRAHSVEERLARWLLMTHDRMPNHNGNPPVPITHELMARMLGARRSTVTIAAGILQKGNFIHYQRGLVTIVDRHGLENVSCECYDSVRTEYERLFKNGAGRQP